MLSEKEKDALAEHFRGKDIYKPSEDSRQEPADFAPKGMGNGEAGFAKGGPVKLNGGGGPDDAGPDMDVEQNTPEIMADDPEQRAYDNGGVETAYQEALGDDAIAKDQEQHDAEGEAAAAAEKAANPPEEPKDALANVAAPSPVKSLQPDQWGELVNALKARPSIGQSAMSGLAGLADAISTGVARSGNPGFQRNIMEQQQNQKQNLIQALTAKYGHERAQQELGLRGKEVAQGGQRIDEDERAHKANEDETEKARVLTAAQQAIESQRLGQERAHQTAEEQAKNLELTQKGSGPWNALMRKVGLGAPLPQQQNQESPAHPKDTQAVAWAQAHPNDPRAAKIMKANGY